MAWNVGEVIDHICLIGVADPRGLAFRAAQALYRAARRAQGGPLTSRAAVHLAHALGTGDRVLILTGAGAPPELPAGETDGPLGAIALAVALAEGCGAGPIVMAEERFLPPIEAAARALAPNSLPAIRELPEAVTSHAGTRSLIADLQPKAIVSVERLGPNAKGIIHSFRGEDVSETHQSLEVLFTAAEAQGILTVGVGDRGNEIGFGLLRNGSRRVKAIEKSCACPCRGGIGCRVQTDVLVSAFTSNWGAYGIVACLGTLTGRRLLHDGGAEAAVLDACLRAGARDGMTGRAGLTVDGTPLAAQQAILTLLNAVT